MIQRFSLYDMTCVLNGLKKKLIFKCFNKMTIIIMPITNARFNKMLLYNIYNITIKDIKYYSKFISNIQNYVKYLVIFVICIF